MRDWNLRTKEELTPYLVAVLLAVLDGEELRPRLLVELLSQLFFETAFDATD